MSAFYFDSFTNSTLIDVLSIYLGSLLTFISDLQTKLTDNQELKTLLDNIPDALYFDDFQWSLLKGFSGLLAVNLILIFVTWKIYNKPICDRFMKPATSKAIEELKASVSRLKLPKEHTPRI